MTHQVPDYELTEPSKRRITRHLVWVPALIVGVTLLAVMGWVFMLPISDVGASWAGIILSSILAMALIPCLHLAIES